MNVWYNLNKKWAFQVPRVLEKDLLIAVPDGSQTLSDIANGRSDSIVVFQGPLNSRYGRNTLRVWNLWAEMLSSTVREGDSMVDTETTVPPWPFGASEMNRLIRDYDWSGTPLGAIASWSKPLKSAVEQMLDSPLVASLICRTDRLPLYSDAASRVYHHRHPTALGIALHGLWPETQDDVSDLHARCFAGESIHVTNGALGPRGSAAELFNICLTRCAMPRARSWSFG